MIRLGIANLGRTSPTTNQPAQPNAGFITTKWYADDYLSGNIDPTSGRKLFCIYQIESYAKYADTSGTEEIDFVSGRNSHGSTSSLTRTAGNKKLTSSFEWIKCDLRPSANNKMFIAGNGSIYYTGIYATSTSGAITVRDPNDNGEVKDEEASPLSGQQALKIHYFGLPNKVSGLSVTADGSSSVSLSWTAATAPDTEGHVTKYRIEYSASSSFSSSSFTTTASTETSKTITGLSDDTEYYFRVAAQNRISTFSGWSAASGPWSDSKSATTEPAVVVTPSFSGAFGNGEVNKYYDDKVTVSNADSIQTRSGHTIPTGLTVETTTDTDGKISYRLYGTPTVAGTYSIRLDAIRDGVTTSDTNDSITIDPEPVPEVPVWNDQEHSTIYIDVPYSSQVTAQNATSYSTSSTQLDNFGLSLNTSNGTISGTPINPGQQILGELTVTIIATGEGGSEPKTFSIETRFPARVKTGTSTSTRATTAQRYDAVEDDWIPIQHAKRHNGSGWVDFTGF